jgi:hypothetical protein
MDGRVDDQDYNDGAQNDHPIGKLNARYRCPFAKPFHDVPPILKQRITKGRRKVRCRGPAALSKPSGKGAGIEAVLDRHADLKNRPVNLPRPRRAASRATDHALRMALRCWPEAIGGTLSPDPRCGGHAAAFAASALSHQSAAASALRTVRSFSVSHIPSASYRPTSNTTVARSAASWPRPRTVIRQRCVAVVFSHTPDGGRRYGRYQSPAP